MPFNIPSVHDQIEILARLIEENYKDPKDPNRKLSLSTFHQSALTKSKPQNATARFAIPNPLRLADDYPSAVLFMMGLVEKNRPEGFQNFRSFESYPFGRTNKVQKFWDAITIAQGDPDFLILWGQLEHEIDKSQTVLEWVEKLPDNQFGFGGHELLTVGLVVPDFPVKNGRWVVGPGDQVGPYPDHLTYAPYVKLKDDGFIWGGIAHERHHGDLVLATLFSD